MSQPDHKEADMHLTDRRFYGIEKVDLGGNPARQQRHPPGCPDADWCRGNGCWWDCRGIHSEPPTEDRV